MARKNDAVTKKRKKNKEQQKEVEEVEVEVEEEQVEEDNDEVDEVEQSLQTVCSDYSRIQTRVSPNCLYKATKEMSPQQMDIVRRIGFGRILEIEFNKIPLGLGYFCVEHFNHETGAIEIPSGNINITRDSINKMFGIPMEENQIETSMRPKKGETSTNLWRSQYSNRVITPPLIVDRIVKTKCTGWTFILDFLVLCASTIIEGNQLGSANFKFLKCIKNEEEIKKLDWCGYMLNSLKEGVKSWKDETTGDKFVASLTCLVVSNSNIISIYIYYENTRYF